MKAQEEIYFVLPLQLAQFKLIQQVSSIVTVDMIQQDHTSEAVLNALKYRYPLNWLGKNAQNLTVLCIPAREHRISYNKQVDKLYPTIIKVQKQGDLKGYLSGHRSAILVQGDKLIRYKGCGNDSQGFVVQNNQLRGSHFIHTAKRQLFMTKLINEVLIQEYGQASANHPVLFYEFPSNFKDSSLRNDIPLLSKYCCVFQTRGDRRVGTHLISPLQILFLNIVDVTDLSLQNFFKSKSRYDEYGLVQLLVDYQLSLSTGEIFLQKYDKSQQFTNYTTLSELKKYQNKPIKLVQNLKQILQRICIKFNGESQIHQLINIEVNWIQIIRIILQKMGWEMGQVKRVFCQKAINWGFFNDHGYWHCNAHLNNFIVTPPKDNSRLVHPLDFDLAFTQDQYINIDQGANYGFKDKANFQQLLLSQYNAMETSLSGVQVMNFKYSIEEAAKEPNLDIRMTRVLFRDTLIQSFRWGMRKNRQQYARINLEWNQNIQAIDRLVKSCLQLSAHFQT